MSRPKGSRNKSRFTQLTLEGTPEPIDLGTTKLYLQDEVTNTMKDMHHIVQKVSGETLPRAEEYLRSWFDKGYELFQVIFLGIEDAGATYSIMYILIKRE